MKDKNLNLKSLVLSNPVNTLPPDFLLKVTTGEEERGREGEREKREREK